MPEQASGEQLQSSSPVHKVIEGLGKEIEQRLQESREELLLIVEEVSSKISERVEKEGGEPASPALSELLDSVAEIDAASTQAEVLARLLEQATAYASRTALLLTSEDGGLNGWAGAGFDAADPALQRLALPPAPGSRWSAVLEGRGTVPLGGEDCAQLCGLIGVPVSSEGALIPLVLRDQIRAVLYADRADGGVLHTSALQMLTHAAAQALEILPLRQSHSSPTLALRSDDTAGDERHAAPGTPQAPSAATETAAAEAPAPAPAAPPASPPPAAAAAPEPAQTPPPAAFEPATPTTRELPQQPIPEPPPAPEPELTMPAEAPPPPAAPPAPEPPPEPAPVQATPEPPPLMTPEPPQAVQPESPEPPAEDLTPGERAAGFVLEPVQPADTLVPPMPGRRSLTEEVPLELIDAAGDSPQAETPPSQSALDAGWSLEPESPTTPVEPAPPPPIAPPAPEPSQPSLPPFEAPQNSVLEELQQAQQMSAEPPAIPTPTEGASRETQLIPQAGALSEVPPPAPATPPEPAPPAGGEITPPSDVEGPGWAFSAQSEAPAGNEPLHDEARRLARLLVSEIKLYNEEFIAEGKRKGNIYQELREDIDRSRQMYEERIDEQVRTTSDYFRDELVRSLAGGDASIMGL